MKKKLCLIFIVIIFCNSYRIHADTYAGNYFNYNTAFIQNTISIKDLILFKNYSNEQIHDYLILNNWIYVSNETTRKGGSIIPHQVQVILYKHNYDDINISIIKTVHFKDGKRDVIAKTNKSIAVTTDSPNEYKAILNDLYKNSFKIEGNEREYASIEIATSNTNDLINKMKKEYVSTAKSSRDYTNGIDKVSLFTETLKKYDNNMKELKRIEYSLILDNNKVIKKIVNSNKSSIPVVKTDKQVNSYIVHNQELLEQNENLKNLNEELQAMLKSSTISSTKSTLLIEKFLENIKEKDLKISRMQDALIKKDSVTLELIKNLKAQIK
jgi:hypothetical protein